MTLDRRDFLKLAATAGLVVGGLPLIPHARAASRTHRGPFWITIHASGGWDPTLLCDPKGRRSASQLDPVNNYFVDEIQQVGPFRIAPVEGHLEFFERFQNDLLVLNGVDTQTNSHTTGTRYTWCGSMNPGFPGFSAVVAATAESEPTLGFLTNGGYSTKYHRSN